MPNKERYEQIKSKVENNQESFLKALEYIKEFCDYYGCHDCPVAIGSEKAGLECPLIKDTPCNWKLEK